MNDQVTRILDAHGGIADIAARLSGPGRELHRAVLRRFLSTGQAPTRRWLRQAASELGIGTSAADELASLDLVHTENSIVKVAYPFSGAPTAHRVVLEGAPPVYAMCAVDALGLPAMTGRDGQIASTDPANGKPVTVTVTSGTYTWEPASTVVTHSVAARPADGTHAAYSCPLVNFHTNTASAQAFISGRDTDMVILDQDTAVELAAYEFGPLLC